MIEIILSSTKDPLIDPEFLTNAVKMTLKALKKDEVDVTLKLTDNAEIKQINQTYRGINQTTDVLSFSQDFFNPETGRKYLGDIIISVEKAHQQAEQYNLSINEECAYLAIHGTLHLLGFDHEEKTEKTEMWALQEKIFSIVKSNYKENVT